LIVSQFPKIELDLKSPIFSSAPRMCGDGALFHHPDKQR
jgi:hypothetical protein